MSKFLSLLLGTQALLGAVVRAQHEPYVQVPLSGSSNAPVVPRAQKAITPEFSKYVENLMKEGGVPGLALGVVHANGESEYGAWGIRSEEGEGMTTDVRYLRASADLASKAYSKFIHGLDNNLSCFMLQSISFRLHGHPHG